MKATWPQSLRLKSRTAKYEDNPKCTRQKVASFHLVVWYVHFSFLGDSRNLNFLDLPWCAAPVVLIKGTPLAAPIPSPHCSDSRWPRHRFGACRDPWADAVGRHTPGRCPTNVAGFPNPKLPLKSVCTVIWKMKSVCNKKHATTVDSYDPFWEKCFSTWCCLAILKRLKPQGFVGPAKPRIMTWHSSPVMEVEFGILMQPEQFTNCGSFSRGNTMDIPHTQKGILFQKSSKRSKSPSKSPKSRWSS